MRESAPSCRARAAASAKQSRTQRQIGEVSFLAGSTLITHLLSLSEIPLSVRQSQHAAEFWAASLNVPCLREAALPSTSFGVPSFPFLRVPSFHFLRVPSFRFLFLPLPSRSFAFCVFRGGIFFLVLS